MEEKEEERSWTVRIGAFACISSESAAHVLVLVVGHKHPSAASPRRPQCLALPDRVAVGRELVMALRPGPYPTLLLLHLSCQHKRPILRTSASWVHLPDLRDWCGGAMRVGRLLSQGLPQALMDRRASPTAYTAHHPSRGLPSKPATWLAAHIRPSPRHPYGIQGR